MVLEWVLLLFQLFTFGTSYYVYSTVDELTGIKYDCIYSYIDPKSFENIRGDGLLPYQQPKEQITSYCLVAEHFTNNESFCTANGGVSWSFEQLKKVNITSNNLIHWNATVNSVDEYERYIQTGNNALDTFRFCNCTAKFHFGTHCQYTFELTHESFDTILASHFSNLNKIGLAEAPLMNDADVTCYTRDASCRGNCLDWRQICNGIVDCNDSQDEILCHLLEFNECLNDEYRCRSGHCIPMTFAFDTTYDCADGSDEENIFITAFPTEACYRKVPNLFCDDFNDAWMRFPCGDGASVEISIRTCANQRQFRTLQQLYANDNTPCWQYMLCALFNDDLFPLLVNCSELCDGTDRCPSLLSSMCPARTVVFPSKPVMFSPSVYFVYLTNKTEHLFSPDFICYTKCDHLYPPSSKQHGYSCRSIVEFHSATLSLSNMMYSLHAEIEFFFAGCTNNTEMSNSSSIFHCPITGGAISHHRIKDGFGDCHLATDESVNGSRCIQNSNQRFRCWTTSDECVHLRFVQDDRPHCSDQSDEFYQMKCIYGTELACNYRRGLYRPKFIQYEFQDLCNGYEKSPSLLWLINGTDETDCKDFWCLSSPTTRCNGYWDCADGHDELNCSLTSLDINAKSAKLLHTLHGCDVTEHFCFRVSNRSGNSSRSCISVSHAGDGHVDCWGASDERHSICDYMKISRDPRKVYRCTGESNKCLPFNEICNGRYDCPMEDDEKLCNWVPASIGTTNFYCRNGTSFSRRRVQCNGMLDCADGEDEWFCDLQLSAPRHRDFSESQLPLYPPGLQNISTQSIHLIQTPVLASSSALSSWYCNRGIPVRNGRWRRCLCPSSYSGERCENQLERISVILQIISPPSFQQDIAIKLIVYLKDIASLTILAEEEILHLPYVHSLYKHIVLLSSIRANNSFVRIDAYVVSMQKIIGYRTSWKFNLHFPFLPVRRLAIKLVLTDDENSVSKIRFTCHACVHGQCLTYQNSDDVFCHCYDGWTGPACNESFVCAPGAKSLSSWRCLCPMNRHGTRCFVLSIVCQCQNGATCIPLDARTGQSVCLCLDNYFGRHCERQHASLTIKMLDKHQPEVLPIILFQFIGFTVYNTLHFENTFLFERVSMNQTLVIYHVDYEYLPFMVLSKVFYSSSIDDYTYYIVLYIPMGMYVARLKPKHVQTQLETGQRCLHVREMEIFKTPINILAYPYIKRIKFYPRACAGNITRCFHDETYLCFCSVRDDQAVSCIIHDHTRDMCQKPNYCLNEGLCVENRRKGIVEFVCLCSSCHYYGTLCQFSIEQQGLSLDALIGTEMRTGKTLSEQSLVIKMSMAILITMITLGFIGNILCIITFAQKTSRETGCGYYLLVTSIYNQLALVVLGLRFVYLLVTQMVVWNNRARLLILCQSLEFGITILPNLSNWLSACVSVERTFTVARGALFDKQTSIRTAKRLCIVLLIILTGITIHEPITRHLIEDPRLGRFTWCITKFSSTKLQTLASILSIVHLLGPFLVNLFSTGVLIVIITRQKLTVRKGKASKPFKTVLREQISYYRHLIISPAVLLVLALPRLIISLGSLCIDTSWRNYVFLAGYFISFMPFVATLFIFILPAPVYRDELKRCLLSVRRLFVSN